MPSKPYIQPVDLATNICSEDDAISAQRHVSDTQPDKARRLMQKYRLQLGQTGHRTGITLDLIDAIVSKCGYIHSAEDIFLKFEIWDMEHAQTFFNIINEVCKGI